MKCAVRYFSLHGRTQAIAEEIAAGAGVEAVSIADEPELSEHYDVLFLGGAPYWNVMDPALQAYAECLDPALVGKVVLFSTSNWSRRTVLALRRILGAKGIAVDAEHFYSHMTQVDARRAAARDFGRDQVAALDRPAAPDATAIIVEAIAAAAIVTMIVATARCFAKRVSR